MRSVKSRGNRSTELMVRVGLMRKGVRGWHLHPRNITGTPDFYFPAAKVAVFIDGCFWHGCPRCGHIPKTNTAFWKAKIARNEDRDKRTTYELRHQGIKVIRVWEHAIKDKPSKIVNWIDQKVRSRD